MPRKCKLLRFKSILVEVKRFLEEANEKVRTFHGIYYCSSDLDSIVDVINDENRKYSVFFGGNEKVSLTSNTVQGVQKLS